MPIHHVPAPGPLAIARKWQSQAVCLREGARLLISDDHQRTVLLRAARAADHAAERFVAGTAALGHITRYRPGVRLIVSRCLQAHIRARETGFGANAAAGPTRGPGRDPPLP